MLPGNVDPRRPDKVQRYKPQTANGQGEDLTPDYMNILGQRATTANATTAESAVDSSKHVTDGGGTVTKTSDVKLQQQQQQQQHSTEPAEETSSSSSAKSSPPNNTNVIPTSPQYGVAIIPNNAIQLPTIDNSIPSETVTTIVTDTVTDTTAKQPPDDVGAGKDLHSTPSRNDRFKVVKIASLEPFKRGRWKCMDYVDEAPPPSSSQPSKATQSASNIPVATGGVYLQTQSLPQQQIQQMLLQSGYANGTQFFQTVPAQMIPQTQYFYPAGANMQAAQNVPQQLVNVVPGSIPAQFINASQPYFATGVVPNSAGFAALPPNYQNIQTYPTNILSNQNQSAFVPPTSQPAVQLPVNFQQSQSYSGQPTQINGHAFPPQSEQQPPQQLSSNNTSTSATKNVMNTNVQPPAASQSQVNQIQSQIPLVQSGTQSRSVPVIQTQQQPYPNSNFQQQPQQPVIPQSNPSSTTNPQVPPPSNVTPQAVASQGFDQNQANNVYTNPQFDMNVNSLTVLENPEGGSAENVNEVGSGTEVAAAASDSANDDPSKTNPVVNAIDNKIEQAMDLVKSHLMYTVREEVEVLKEKIAELMEKIQQLETENNFLRSQIPKNAAATLPAQTTTSSTAAPNPTTTTTTSTAPATTSSAADAAVPQQPPTTQQPPQQQQQ